MFIKGISSFYVSSLDFVCLFTFVAAGVFCLVYFYFPLLFLFKIYFSNHKPFSFSGLPAKAVILQGWRAIVCLAKTEGWQCAFLLWGHLQRWSWSREGSTHENQLRPRWVWDPALLGHYTAWSLLLLMAKITYSLHYTSFTVSHRCKKLSAS